MVKKIFKPFWSYDVKGTEDWLHSMALQGHHLKAINTRTRYFVFEEDNNPREVRYHIEYAKTPTDTLPAALENDGWECAFRGRKWYVLSNEKPAATRKTFPVRDGVIRRNRLMMYLFSGMCIYTLLTTLLFIIMCGLMVLFGYTLTIQVNAFWIMALTIGVAFWALAPYSTIKLYKTNHKYW